MGFEKTLNLAQQSQISLQVKSNSRINECCFVMLIIYLTISLTFTSTHTNCLIQLLKSVSIKSFVSTEAAHSTAALFTCQAVFEEFFVSSQPLALSINSHLSSAGGESYSVQNRCQPPLSTASDQPDRSHQQRSTTTLSARRILLEFAIRATLFI